MVETIASPSDNSLHELQRPLRELQRQFNALIEPHRPDLYAYCLRLTGSPFDAEDLVQETLSRALGRLFQYYQPLESRPYLFRTATNIWIDACRRAQRLRFVPLDDDVASSAYDIEPDEADAAWAALADLLEPRQRVAVLLKDVFDFSLQEIATFLETTPGAVKALLHRGRRRISRNRDAPVREPDAGAMRLARAYAERLSAGNWDGIAALLRADATVSIVGVDEEIGLDWIRATSLADSAQHPLPGNDAELVLLDGEPLVLWLFESNQGVAIRDVIRLTTDGEQITHVRQYWYCPDVVREVGRRLGRLAVPDGVYGV